jgi:arylsulfatase
LKTRAATALILLALCSCVREGAPRAARVILITCDTLRADRLGMYGCEQPTSPALDAFAREAILFEEAYSAAPWTQPSLSSLMTGRSPEELGIVPGNVRRIGAGSVTLAERLSERGIATAAVVSNVLLKRVSPPPGVPGPIGLEQGFAHYDDRMDSREAVRAFPERVAQDTTDAALAWLDARAGGASEPFFLWLHYQDPHGPYTPPPPHDTEFQRAQRDGLELPLGTTMRGLGQIPKYQVLGQERRADVYRERYDGEVRYFDRAVGRFLAQLRQRGLYEDALILFTSDHGESLGEHDYWFCHGENLQREVVRVPLLIRFPGGDGRRIAPGADGYRRVQAVASLYDLWATILGAFDLPPGPSRGRALLDPAALPLQRPIVHSFVPLEQPCWWAVSDGRYRLLWSEKLPTPRLFDVRADPREQHDLAAGEPDRVQALLSAHAAWEASPVGAKASGSATGSDVSEDLQRLGYAEAAGDPH